VVGGDGLRIGVLGYAEGNPTLHHHLATDSRPGAAPIDLELIRADVTALRQTVDRVVVSLHWGVNYTPYAMPQQRELARTLLSLGVDVILGTHPHVISGVEWIEGKPVAYSLGDFVCDPTIGNVVLPERIRARRETAVLQLDPAGAHTWIPYRADESCQPHRLTGAAAAEALAELQRRDARYSDGSYPADPWAAAGETIGGHALQVLWFHLKRGNIGYLSQRFLRIRPRHLRMLRGLLLRSR
jgi:poly-gamma-glutamate synthesis protein (capsule biosynthesis protein)